MLEQEDAILAKIPRHLRAAHQVRANPLSWPPAFGSSACEERRCGHVRLRRRSGCAPERAPDQTRVPCEMLPACSIRSDMRLNPRCGSESQANGTRWPLSIGSEYGPASGIRTSAPPSFVATGALRKRRLICLNQRSISICCSLRTCWNTRCWTSAPTSVISRNSRACRFG